MTVGPEHTTAVSPRGRRCGAAPCRKPASRQPHARAPAASAAGSPQLPKFLEPLPLPGAGIVVAARHGRKGHLAYAGIARESPAVAREQLGIYRGEVRAIMIALAEIIDRLDRILAYIEGDAGEEETDSEDT